MADLSLALPQTATLGEGLQWHVPSGRWWWTDIAGCTLSAWSPRDGSVWTIPLPQRAGSFAHTTSGRLLIGMEKGLYLGQFEPGTPSIRLQALVSVEPGELRTRINDGRCDRHGHFVFGTMNESDDGEAIGRFYQYSGHHGLRPLNLPRVVIANSLCFSLDGRRMYFCDTVSRVIHQCDYDADAAQVRNIRPFVTVDEPDAWPDGSTVDAQGCLWNARWGAGQVARYSPAGQLLQVMTLAAPHATCPAIGGEGGVQLMVTTARQGLTDTRLAEAPLSGGVFGAQLPERLAVDEARFDDTR